MVLVLLWSNPDPQGFMQAEPEAHFPFPCPVPSHTGLALHEEFL